MIISINAKRYIYKPFFFIYMTNLKLWRRCLNDYYKNYKIEKKKDIKCKKLYQDYIKCTVKCF